MTSTLILIFTLFVPSLQTFRPESYSIKSELQRQIRGLVHLRGSPEYETSRPVHNGLCRDIYPLLIVKPFDTEDVAACVKIATKYGIELSVRSGGHSYQCLGIKVSFENCCNLTSFSNLLFFSKIHCILICGRSIKLTLTSTISMLDLVLGLYGKMSSM